MIGTFESVLAPSLPWQFSQSSVNLPVSAADVSKITRPLSIALRAMAEANLAVSVFIFKIFSIGGLLVKVLWHHF